jgi:hypothetical protein
MNLWVKRTGQLFFIAVLFLMSCEDDTYLLGFRNQNKKFNVRYQELSLPSAVLTVDSLVTDNHDIRSTATRRFLIGEYDDDRFGTVRSEVFTQVQPSFTALIPTAAIYDSVTIQLRLDLYSYGSEGTHDVHDETFTIHEIVEDSLSFYERYFYNSTFNYDVVPLGTATYTFNYDTIKKNQSLGAGADTLVAKTRLDDEYGIRLFNLSKVDHNDNEKFRWDMKGIAFIPTQSETIVGFDPNSTFTKVIVHYHTATDTLERAFYMNPLNGGLSAASFNKISTARTGDLAAITQTYESYQPPSGLRYLQSGSPVITKIDLSEYYSFIRGDVAGTDQDSLVNIVLNSAEITIDGVETFTNDTPPPSALVLRVMNSDDLFLDSQLDADSTAMAGYYYAFDGKYYVMASDVLNDPSIAAVLSYNSDEKKYSGFITLSLQNLFEKKDINETDLLYLGVFPVTPATGKSVNRAVFNENGIKLKLHYTSPVVSNQ